MSTYSSLPRAESLLTLQRRVPSLCILAARLLFANAWHVDSWREPGGERNGAWSFASLCGHASVVQPHGACVQSLFHHLPKCRPDRGRMTSSGEETSEQTREETIRNVESEYHEINSKCAWPMIYQVRKGAGRGRRKKGKEREKERKGETVRSSAAISVSGGTARLPRAGYSLSLSLSLVHVLVPPFIIFPRASYGYCCRILGCSRGIFVCGRCVADCWRRSWM